VIREVGIQMRMKMMMRMVTLMMMEVFFERRGGWKVVLKIGLDLLQCLVRR
jgi:uncharacterized membrane protein